MGFHEHLKTFAGMPVRTFEPGKKGKRPAAPCAYRLGCLDEDGDDECSFPELLDLFLAEHGGKGTTALVVGAWSYDELVSEGAQEVVAALVAGRDRLPNLKALFFGDITRDECEVSWIQHGDLAPLFGAFPKLDEFHVRGAADLTFGKLRHDKLKTFVIQSGGLPAQVLEELWAAELPKLGHLELWLGEDHYGGINDPAPLAPLLEGKLYPKLRYLGLRNSAVADKVAAAAARSPLVGRLHTLDLSLGILTDVGAEALLTSPSVRKLKKLDLHHHFLSSVFVRELKKMPIEVDLSEQQEPHFYRYGDTTDVWRFIVASE